MQIHSINLCKSRIDIKSSDTAVYICIGTQGSYHKNLAIRAKIQAIKLRTCI